jgi:hypothetical protein
MGKKKKKKRTLHATHKAHLLFFFFFFSRNNVVRMHIYKVLDGVSKDHLTKIINVDETMRRILPVLGSNDPTARALTLR